MVGRVRSSLSWKVFLSMMGILLGVSLLIFTLLHRAMPRSYARLLDSQVMENAVVFIDELQMTPRSDWEQLVLLFSIQNNAGVVIQEVDSDVYESESYGIFISEQIAIGDDEGVAVISGGGAIISDLFGTRSHLHTSVMFSFAFEYNMTQYVMAVESNNFVRAVSQMENIFLQLAPAIFLIILGVSLVTAFLYTRFLARPVVDIARQSMKLVDLDGSWQWESSRSDEIGMLGGYLKLMYDQLMRTLSELRVANAKLQDDIERERRHERRRRDFFTAVSHELKTPVTILKGELDGMILNVGKFKDRDKYLREAYQTSESIEKLVREIMTLAKLDTINLELERICLARMVKDVIEIYESMVEDEDKELEILLPSEVVNVSADVVQLQTALSNIISNAIKHTPERNCIRISLKKEKETAVLMVENEGVYLEEEEIVKLWEPFYRPDKSRSRDTGGSGLGLYIVKSILDLHGIEYELANSADGIRFVVRMPVES